MAEGTEDHKGESCCEEHSFFYRFTCKYYTEKALEREDSSLSSSDQFYFKLHHIICTFCRRFARQQRAIRKGLEQLFAEDATEPMPEEAKGAIRAELNGKLSKKPSD